MKDVGIESANVHIELDFSLRGSVIEGTVESNVSEVRSFFSITSNDPESLVREVVKLAKQGCFAESMIINPVNLSSTIILNGNEIVMS
jgi:hypothetical protein